MTRHTLLTLPRANLPLAALLHKPRKSFALHPEQRRFLDLHKQFVVMWRWHWGSSILRAHTEGGHTATISAAHFDELVRAGLMRRSGFGATITERGKVAV